jgi:hypothetical protein
MIVTRRAALESIERERPERRDSPKAGALA